MPHETKTLPATARQQEQTDYEARVRAREHLLIAHWLFSPPGVRMTDLAAQVPLSPPPLATTPPAPSVRMDDSTEDGEGPVHWSQVPEAA